MDKINNYWNDIAMAAKATLPWHILTGKNILVLGSTGLIGGCIIDILMQHSNTEYNVYAGGRDENRASKCFARYSNRSNFHFIKIDVTCPIKYDIQFHYIIDAASGANPHLYATDPVGIMRANFLGVDNLLSYGKEHGMLKFIYVSSGEVYGEGHGEVFTENFSGYVDPTEVRSCYPSSKRAAETLCVSYAKEYGLDVSIARPSHVYGPHFTDSDNRVYAQFIRNVLHGEDIVMKSSGKQFRSWCYVVDCASALIYIMLKGENGQAYNIADESSNISIRELANMVATIAGRKVVLEKPDEEERAGFSIVSKAVFDTTKLENLGWKITGTMESKIASTIVEARAIHQ